MAADSTTSPRPDARFLLAHPAHFIALGFGAGLSPVAPGTVGTAFSLLAGLALSALMPLLAVAFLAVPLFFLGVWACGIAGRQFTDRYTERIVSRLRPRTVVLAHHDDFFRPLNAEAGLAFGVDVARFHDEVTAVAPDARVMALPAPE